MVTFRERLEQDGVPSGVDNPQATITGTNSWVSVSLPAGDWIDFGVDEYRAFVVVGSSTQPTQDGCGYGVDTSHRKKCTRATHLWVKNYTAGENAKVSWSVFN